MLSIVSQNGLVSGRLEALPEFATITVDFQRFESDGRVVCGNTKKTTPSKAFSDLVQFELGFGGCVVSLDSRSVEVRTNIFGRYDVTRFSGPAEHMRVLLSAVSVYRVMKSALMPKLIDDMMEITQGSPLLISAGLGIFTGSPPARATAACLVATSEDQATRLMKVKKDEDFYSIVELLLEGASFESAISLVS